MDMPAKAKQISAAQFARGRARHRARAGGLSVLHASLKPQTTSASGSTTPCTSGAHVGLRHGHGRGGVLRPRFLQYAACIACPRRSASTTASSTAAFTSAATRSPTRPRSPAGSRNFKQRAFYYYANWERLYAQWREKMMALIETGAGTANAAAAGVRATRATCTPAVASLRITRCWTPTRRRSKDTSGCGTTISSFCCLATAPI